MDSTFFHYVARVERMVKKCVLKAVFSLFLMIGTKGNILDKSLRRFKNGLAPRDLSKDGYIELF